MAQQGLSDCCKFKTYTYHIMGGKQQRHLHGNNCNTTSGSSSHCMQRMASSLSYSVHSKSWRCTASVECPLHDAWVDSMENKLLPCSMFPLSTSTRWPRKRQKPVRLGTWWCRKSCHNWLMLSSKLPSGFRLQILLGFTLIAFPEQVEPARQQVGLNLVTFS